MSKNLLIIISILVIGAIVGVGVYFGTQKKELPASDVFNQEEIKGTEKIQQEETFGGETAVDKLSQLKEVYQGFKEAKVGDWVIWEIKGVKESATAKNVFVGQETIDGKNCYGWEFSGKFQGTEVAFQVWLSKEDNTPVKYVAKAPQGVFCLAPTMYKPQGEVSPQAGTPAEYEPENIAKLNFETGTFITGSGKTVKVVKVFNPDESQVWISSQVPFGIVKAISPEGETMAELKDFGSGAPLEITKSERDNCQQIPSGLFPGF